MHVTVHYARQSSAEEARRVASALGRLFGNVELRYGVGPYKVPTLVYYHPLDREQANALARSLESAPPVAVRAGPGRVATGSFDLWLR